MTSEDERDTAPWESCSMGRNLFFKKRHSSGAAVPLNHLRGEHQGGLAINSHLPTAIKVAHPFIMETVLEPAPPASFLLLSSSHLGPWNSLLSAPCLKYFFFQNKFHITASDLLKHEGDCVLQLPGTYKTLVPPAQSVHRAAVSPYSPGQVMFLSSGCFFCLEATLCFPSPPNTPFSFPG